MQLQSVDPVLIPVAEALSSRIRARLWGRRRSRSTPAAQERITSESGGTCQELAYTQDPLSHLPQTHNSHRYRGQGHLEQCQIPQRWLPLLSCYNAPVWPSPVAARPPAVVTRSVRVRAARLKKIIPLLRTQEIHMCLLVDSCPWASSEENIVSIVHSKPLSLLNPSCLHGQSQGCFAPDLSGCSS